MTKHLSKERYMFKASIGSLPGNKTIRGQFAFGNEELQVQPSLRALLICLPVISSLNHRDATDLQAGRGPRWESTQ